MRLPVQPTTHPPTSVRQPEAHTHPLLTRRSDPSQHTRLCPLHTLPNPPHQICNLTGWLTEEKQCRLHSGLSTALGHHLGPLQPRIPRITEGTAVDNDMLCGPLNSLFTAHGVATLTHHSFSLLHVHTLTAIIHITHLLNTAPARQWTVEKSCRFSKNLFMAHSPPLYLDPPHHPQTHPHHTLHTHPHQTYNLTGRLTEEKPCVQPSQRSVHDSWSSPVLLTTPYYSNQ